MTEITRRKMMGGLVAGVASSPLVAGAAHAKEAGMKKYDNGHFYSSDGGFDAEVATKAYYEMMEHYGYPIVDRLKGEEFWTIDFGLGEFSEVGMAGIFWVNRKEDDYFGHEIYLLPGQMIPEHKHLKTADARPKMEAWQVRHGSIHIYGEGDPTPGMKVPPTHKDCLVAKLEKQLLPGEVGYLTGPEEWHWMRAGSEGAIVTEYASYHDGNGLRFSHPKVAF
jgi:D-lyxose ketol-isomerase